MQFPTTEVDFWPPLSEVADMEKQDLSLESFDKDIEAMEDLFRTSHWFSPPVQDTFSYYHDTSLPDLSTPSTLTYSTESDYELSPSQYDFAPSDYSTPPDVVTGGWSPEQFYSAPDSIYSDGISNGPSSFELPPSPTLNPVDAHSDYGTSNPYQSLFEITDPSFTLQQPATVVSPTHDCVQVMPDTQAYATPDRPFKCPLCPFASKRKFNLKTHLETHDKGKPKPFRCTTCGSRFSRKHDLKRHHGTMHGDQKSSSSAYSGSAVAPGLAIGFPVDFEAYFRGV